MVKPLSLQLALTQQLSRILQTIPAQGCLSPATVPYRLRRGRSPETISYICDFGSDLPLHHRQSLASITLAAWDNPCGVTPLPWPEVIGSHCGRKILPSGQILLTPTPLALGNWLWQLATTEEHFQAWPQVGLPISDSWPDSALAQRLQLSVRAVVAYTHDRCRQLLTIAATTALSQPPPKQIGQSIYLTFSLTGQPCPQPVDQGYGLEPDLALKVNGGGGKTVDLCDRLYPVGHGKAVLRGLVKLVDCLSLAPLAPGNSPESPVFNAAYGLSMAVDQWLGYSTIDRGDLSTIALLRGIDWALAAALSAQSSKAATPR